MVGVAGIGIGGSRFWVGVKKIKNGIFGEKVEYQTHPIRDSKFLEDREDFYDMTEVAITMGVSLLINSYPIINTQENLKKSQINTSFRGQKTPISSTRSLTDGKNYNVIKEISQGKVFINNVKTGETTMAYQKRITYPDGSMRIFQENLTTGEISLQKINPLGQRISETSLTPYEANTLIGANSSSKMLVGNGAVSQSVISKVSYQTGNNSLVLYDKTPVPVTNGTLVAPLTVPLLTNGANKVAQVQNTLTPKANINNMDLLKAFKRVEDKKNYYYSKLTTTMETEGVKFRFSSIEYALNERATEELQKNPLTMPTEMQEHIFGEIKHLRNGTIKATGGHVVSDQVKISDISNIQYNNVFQAKVEIYDPVTNQYILKSNNNGLSTFFPPYWTKDRVLIEAESAFRNKVPHSDPDMLQKGFDEGKTKSGVKVDIGRKTLYPQERQ